MYCPLYLSFTVWRVFELVLVLAVECGCLLSSRSRAAGCPLHSPDLPAYNTVDCLIKVTGGVL